MSTEAAKPATQRVKAALYAAGIDVEVVAFAESTRTAEQAAAAVGTGVGSIVKSLVFMVGAEPILALVSGANRLSIEKLAARLGQSVRRANAAEVRAATGFAIGGVPPLGHDRALRIYIDRDLISFDRVYAAAGTPNSVFPISPNDLTRVTSGAVIDLAEQ